MHAQMSVSEPLHPLFYPGIPRDCKNMELRNICHKEITNIAIWSQCPQEVIQSLSRKKEQVEKKLLAHIVQSFSDITRCL